MRDFCRVGRRPLAEIIRALALVLSAAAPTAGLLAQQPASQTAVSSGVGVTQSRPTGNSNVIPPQPISASDVIAAAAKAAGIAMPSATAGGVQPDPAQPGKAKPGNPFAVKVQAPARQSATQPTVQATEQGVVIPANPVDPEKVLVNEDDGLVSLMVREGSLRQVVSMIAEAQKLNIVFAGPTDTLVTASFDRQPWQTVLDSLLAGSGHAWAVRDNVIFIASLEMSSYLLPGADGRRVEVFELDFASAVDVDQTVKGLLSPAGESWLVETNKADNRRTREAVAVVDYPSSLARISDYICQADQPPRQVYIEAHILQVELDDNCRSGVNFENLIRLPSASVNLNSVGFANDAASPAFFVDVDGVGLDGVIELLQTTTDAKTLAKPNIHAVSGQESHIQIGGQLGYRITTTTQTSTMESVQFLDVGVVLRVTPRITRDGRVLMRIYPKVSTGQVDPETGLPSEETTEVETDVLVNSGQGIVIGGLIQEVDSVIQSKIPLLGDIPYAGILFQKRQQTKSRHEIIVTLEPHVLPYSPIVQAKLEHDYMRSVEPLTQGALHSYPRPYEPSLPDALHPKKHKTPVSHWDPQPISTEFYELPPVELVTPDGGVMPRETQSGREAMVEELPAPDGDFHGVIRQPGETP